MLSYLGCSTTVGHVSVRGDGSEAFSSFFAVLFAEVPVPVPVLVVVEVLVFVWLARHS